MYIFRNETTLLYSKIRIDNESRNNETNLRLAWGVKFSSLSAPWLRKIYFRNKMHTVYDTRGNKLVGTFWKWYFACVNRSNFLSNFLNIIDLSDRFLKMFKSRIRKILLKEIMRKMYENYRFLNKFRKIPVKKYYKY